VRKVSLDNVKAGDKLAVTIFSLNNSVLLTKGSELTPEIIDYLKQYGITEVCIDDEISKNIAVPGFVRAEILQETKTQVKKIMTHPSIKTSVDGEAVLKIVEKLIEEILQSDQIIINLSDIRSIDDYMFSHSVNVAIFSLVTGITLGFEGEELRNLGVGAILHDVGKVRSSDSILKKPTALTIGEYEEVRKHTVFGYEILGNSKNIAADVREISLYHHERMDGSGYPYKLKGNEIPPMARIVAIADVFDALTTDRIYRKKMHVSHVVDYMFSLSNKHFDKRFLEAFLRHIANYPVGTGVVLNTGEKGLVSKYNPYWPNRPVIRVLIDSSGRKLAHCRELDLSLKPDYFIEDIWDI